MHFHLFKFAFLPLRTISSVLCPVHGLDEVLSAVPFTAFHVLEVSIRSRADHFVRCLFCGCPFTVASSLLFSVSHKPACEFPRLFPRLCGTVCSDSLQHFRPHLCGFDSFGMILIGGHGEFSLLHVDFQFVLQHLLRKLFLYL